MRFVHPFALMAKPNRYASISKMQSEINGQTFRGLSTSGKRFLLKVASEVLDQGKPLNAEAGGAAVAALRAKGLI